MKYTAAFLVLISAASAFAVSPKEARPGRQPTQPHIFQQKAPSRQTTVHESQIAGCCLLLGSRVRVETLEGKAIKDEEITTIDTFTVSELKPDIYNVIISHPRYKTPLKLERVKTGNWVTFRSP